MRTTQIPHRKQRLESDVTKVNEYPVLSGKYQLYCNQGIYFIYCFYLFFVAVWKMSTCGEERFVGVSEAEVTTDIDHSYP
jgi:hypothetical protein